MLHFYFNDQVRQLLPVRTNFGLDNRVYRLQSELREVVPSFGAEYISAWDALCDGEECLTRPSDARTLRSNYFLTMFI